MASPSSDSIAFLSSALREKRCLSPHNARVFHSDHELLFKRTALCMQGKCRRAPVGSSPKEQKAKEARTPSEPHNSAQHPTTDSVACAAAGPPRRTHFRLGCRSSGTNHAFCLWPFPNAANAASFYLVRLTDQTLSCTARARVPKPVRHAARRT